MNLKRVIMGLGLKHCECASSSYFLIFVILVLDYTTGSYGHLASIMDNNGEPRSPLLQHSREARGPVIYSSESNLRRLGPLSNIKPPSYQHKYLSANRMAKFHNQPITGYFDEDGTGSDYNFAKLFQGMSDTNRAGEPARLISPDAFNSQQSSKEGEGPTFTPYISARALSNMEKFFHHLRENLEALQKDDEEENNTGIEVQGQPQPERRDSETSKEKESNNEDSSTNGAALTGAIIPERDGLGAYSKYFYSHSSTSPGTAEWKPMASGVLGLKKIRSFFPLGDSVDGVSGSNSRTTKFGTNLGIGKK